MSVDFDGFLFDALPVVERQAVVASLFSGAGIARPGTSRIQQRTLRKHLLEYFAALHEHAGSAASSVGLGPEWFGYRSATARGVAPGLLAAPSTQDTQLADTLKLSRHLLGKKAELSSVAVPLDGVSGLLDSGLQGAVVAYVSAAHETLHVPEGVVNLDDVSSTYRNSFLCIVGDRELFGDNIKQLDDMSFHGGSDEIVIDKHAGLLSLFEKISRDEEPAPSAAAPNAATATITTVHSSTFDTAVLVPPRVRHRRMNGSAISAVLATVLGQRSMCVCVVTNVSAVVLAAICRSTENTMIAVPIRPPSNAGPKAPFVVDGKRQIQRETDFCQGNSFCTFISGVADSPALAGVKFRDNGRVRLRSVVLASDRSVWTTERSAPLDGILSPSRLANELVPLSAVLRQYSHL